MSSRIVSYVLLVALASAQDPAPVSRPTSLPIGADAVPLDEYARRASAVMHFGMYFGKSKIGWMTMRTSVGRFDGEPAFVAESETSTGGVSYGEATGSFERTVSYHALSGDGPLLYHEETKVEDGVASTTTVRRDGDGYVVFSHGSGKARTRRISAPKATLRETARLELWAAQPGRKVGDVYEGWSADFSRKSPDVRQRLTYAESRRSLRSGVLRTHHTVDVRVSGVPGRFVVDDEGRPVRFTMAGLYEGRAEEEALAKRLDVAADLDAAAMASVDRPLGDPERVRAMRVRVVGAFEDVPASPRQRVSRDDRGIVVDVDADRDAAPATLDPAPFLDAEPGIESDDADLVAAARRAVGDAARAPEKIERLVRWVHRTLRKTTAANSISAAAILRHGAGDCSEHTRLFVAAARAVGVPAREVGGLVYAGDDARRFAWHAWAEVHDGSRWIAVDPTWNQTVADAARVVFSTDPDDLSWTAAVGTVRFELLDVRTR